MFRSHSTKRVIARIQRLCCAGLGQVVIPEILRELGQHIRSNGPTCLIYSSNSEIVSIHTKQQELTTLWPIYFQEFHRKNESPIWTTPEIARRDYGSSVGDFHCRQLRINYSEYLKSHFYNLLFRPAKWEKIMSADVVSNRKVLALHFPRSANEPSFSRNEAKLLEHLAPFMAHALDDQRVDGPYVETEEKGLIIADERGVIRHISPEARHLLLMAQPASSRRIYFNAASAGHLPNEVVRICANLSAWSDTRPMAVPPIWRYRNEWGEIIFRVFRADQQPIVLPMPHMIGILVELRQPLRLRLLRRVGELPLSNRETELCLALLEGHSRGEIAERLHISATTAITHCRNLYAKLDVHNRMELVEKLRAL